ncbi:MAG: hypothetical protein M1835_005785 [Candelina submexicana]|nr:MAG: hypothetical protein M1835_005785 [Candelina submexicana]
MASMDTDKDTSDRSPSKKPQCLDAHLLTKVHDGPRQLEVYIQQQNASEKLACERTATGFKGKDPMSRYLAEWEAEYGRCGRDNDKR